MTAALPEVLRSIEAVRNLPALCTLLGTFAASGLLLSMAESSLARGGADWWITFELLAAALIAFYGGNAAGMLLMDDAMGVPARDIAAAVRDSLRRSHRLLLVLLMSLAATGLALLLLVGVLWLCRVGVSGTTVGPLLFGLLVPVGVVGGGLTALAWAAVLVPLAAPGVWAGDSVRAVIRQLLCLMRHRFLTVALLMAVVSGLAAAVGAAVTFVVMAGGKLFALLSLTVVGVDVPASTLVAGLLGHGLRSLGAAGAPLGSTGHAAAALVGGGVVFALALLLPGLVYLRGACAVYLAMCPRAGDAEA